jgi:hypothetical protein
LGISSRHLSIKTAARGKHGYTHHWKLSKVDTGPRFATAFNFPYVYDYVTILCRKQAGVVQNHENEYVRGIGQGEANHRKYKRLNLGGGQAYDRSSD